MRGHSVVAGAVLHEFFSAGEGDSFRGNAELGARFSDFSSLLLFCLFQPCSLVFSKTFYIYPRRYPREPLEV